MRRAGLPLMILAVCLAASSAASCFGQATYNRVVAQQGRQVAGRGYLTGGRELQRVLTWQTSNSAHLAIETVSRRSDVLWQADGGESLRVVDSVRISDLNGDNIPEIFSLWRARGSIGAVIRVFHWDRGLRSFVELQFENEPGAVSSYRIVPARGAGSNNRLAVYFHRGAGAGRTAVTSAEYELRGSKLVSRRGGGAVTTPGESGIEGQAIISPVRPGPTREGDSGSAPHKTTLVIWRVSDGHEVARVETGSDGRFRVALPPGTYTVGPPRRGGRMLPRGGEETVTVVPGKFANVTISFDSGMR